MLKKNRSRPGAPSVIVVCGLLLGGWTTNSYADSIAPLRPQLKPTPAEELLDRFHEALMTGLSAAGLQTLTVAEIKKRLGKAPGGRRPCADLRCAETARTALGIPHVAVASVSSVGKNYTIKVQLVGEKGVVQATQGTCDICTFSEALAATARLAQDAGAKVAKDLAETPKAAGPEPSATPGPPATPNKGKPDAQDSDGLPPALFTPGQKTPDAGRDTQTPSSEHRRTQEPAHAEESKTSQARRPSAEVKSGPPAPKPAVGGLGQQAKAGRQHFTPWPLWPALTAAAFGAVALAIGAPFVALNGQGVDCNGEPQADLQNCDNVYTTGGFGWAATSVGIASLAASGLLFYMHLARPTEAERPNAATPAGRGNLSWSIAPSSDGVLVGATGSF